MRLRRIVVDWRCSDVLGVMVSWRWVNGAESAGWGRELGEAATLVPGADGGMDAGAIAARVRAAICRRRTLCGRAREARYCLESVPALTKGVVRYVGLMHKSTGSIGWTRRGVPATRASNRFWIGQEINCRERRTYVVSPCPRPQDRTKLEVLLLGKGQRFPGGHFLASTLKQRVSGVVGVMLLTGVRWC